MKSVATVCPIWGHDQILFVQAFATQPIWGHELIKDER